MKYYFLFGLCLLIIAGCSLKEPVIQEFPIITTLSPIQVDSTGATFRGELMKAGKETLNSYGFVWGIEDPNTTTSFKIIMGNSIDSKKFTKRIDSNFVKGLNYKVRSFATYGYITVYGNLVSVVSKGSTKNAWSMELANSSMDGYDLALGSSCSGLGFILFSQWGFFKYDPVNNVMSNITDFPNPEQAGHIFSTVTAGNKQYYRTNRENSLYTFENGVWTKIGAIPFPFYHLYYQGLYVANSIYFLSSAASYEYLPDSNAWKPVPSIPVSTYASIAGTSLNGKAYVLTADMSIWEFDPQNLSWKNLTKYPGILNSYINSFAFNNKIYFGLSYGDNKLWEYDLLLKSWKTKEDLPIKGTDFSFNFTINNKLYVGMGNQIWVPVSRGYKLFKFDPLK